MKLFLNKFSFLCFLFICLEQSLIATSTYCIAMVGKNITKELNLFWVFMVIGSLILVLVPRTMINLFLVKTKRYVFSNIVHSYHKEFYNKPFLINNQSFNKEYRPYFNNQNWQVITETTNFFQDFISIILNISLNLIVICWQLNSLFFLAYLSSFIIIELFYKISNKKIKQEGIATQVSQTKVSEVLLSGWDTILIGNQHNYQNWAKDFFSIKQKIGNSRRQICR